MEVFTVLAFVCTAVAAVGCAVQRALFPAVGFAGLAVWLAVRIF